MEVKISLASSNMKRIGIVTIVSMNLGNRLQNYALQQSIEKMGYLCKTIPNGNKTNYETKIVIKKLLKPFVKRFANVSWDYFDKNIKWDDMWEIDASPAEYYKFVAGSDQIWNPLFEINSGREFLDFASTEQKTAYAASIGLDRLPDAVKAQYTDYLLDFQHISMREAEGAEIVRRLIGKRVPVVLDPTMLLTAEEWRKISETSSIRPKNKFIAKYILGNKNEQYDDYIENEAKELGVEVIDIGEYNKTHHNAWGPAEFLHLLAQSECFYTDSFHGTVFSILFHKRFIVFERPVEEGYGSMTSRLNTLLSAFDLCERRVHSVDELITEKPEIDYEKIENILALKREASITYLADALR